jgi:hypothetical protein
MSFESDIQRFLAKVEARRHALFLNVASHTLESIKGGDPLTGAPGQPVDTGFLLNSWQLTDESATVKRISTNVAYAPVIEENARAAYDPRGRPRPKEKGGNRPHIRSTVGGHHSVKMTRVNFDRIVGDELEKVKAAIP